MSRIWTFTHPLVSRRADNKELHLTREASGKVANRLRVRDFAVQCSSRPRGRAFYDHLLERARAVPESVELVVSFAGVDFVSPAFLDETVVRLVQEYPAIRGRIAVEGLSEFASKGFATVIRARGVRNVIRTRP